MKCGISILQGPHHVAQKSSSTTLPLNSVNDRSFPLTSFSVKFRFAVFESAGHESLPSPSGTPGVSVRTMAGCFFSSHGICVVTATAASATMPSVAMTHLIRMEIQLLALIEPIASSSVQGGVDECGHSLHLGSRFASDQDERPIPDRPDRRLVSKHLDELLGALGPWEHEQRHGT